MIPCPLPAAAAAAEEAPAAAADGPPDARFRGGDVYRTPFRDMAGVSMFTQRMGLIVWLKDDRQAKGLEKYGNVHYVSKRMKYAVVYINADQHDAIVKNLSRLPYVKKVERSLRHEIPTEFDTGRSGKTLSYNN
jgi:uncharacterized protein YlbG (UPF0298 family)